MEDIHCEIDLVADAAAEIELQRKGAGICKVKYALRLNGSRLERGDLENYSGLIRDSLARTMGGDIPSCRET